jgi:alkylation response protein AidB-like acyl-CoA dehydrogenase
MSEPGAGSDLQGITTTARRDGDQYVINGTKTFIINGSHASIICLAVKTDVKAAGPKGISLIVVEAKDLSGYHVGRPLDTIGMHADCECRIVDECVQLHGGYGYMAEYPIARMWTDSRVHRIYAGTNEILKELIASSLRIRLRPGKMALRWRRVARDTEEFWVRWDARAT